MNKKDSKEIAKFITNEQLKEMFDRARGSITDWTQISKCNKSMTKGVAWNILAKDFNLEMEYSVLAKTNMVREFGEYLPTQLKPIKKQLKETIRVIHQDPIF